MSSTNRIGSKISQLRESHQMTVEELAEKSQSDVELIKRLEEGDLIPSLTPLLKIARALGVRLGTFLDDAPHTGPVIAHGGESKDVLRFSGKCTTCSKSTLDFHALAADKQDRNMEPFLIDVHPPMTSEHKLSSHEGEEFIYVLEGSIEVLYGKDKYKLTKGDSIYYDSIVPHDVHATQQTEAKILAVVYTPQ